jgi:hypothetical protein
MTEFCEGVGETLNISSTIIEEIETHGGGENRDRVTGCSTYPRQTKNSTPLDTLACLFVTLNGCSAIDFSLRYSNTNLFIQVTLET